VNGAPVRLADHLARLDRSCRELYGAGAPVDLGRRVRAAAAEIPRGRAALRVVVAPDLTAAVTAAAAANPPKASVLESAVRTGGLWRHKWADRSWASPALYLSADGTVLETDRGNVFLIADDGTLVTPPLRDDLLPGITRRTVLDLARDAGRPTALRTFSRDELVRHPAFWTSSLSGAVPIRSVDGVELPRADELAGWFAQLLVGGGVRFR
jgi:para-aminobenzoate synthetase/4-amino-4-deoxychorismate lyase